MTKNENERLAVLENEIKNTKETVNKMDCKLDKLMETLPQLVERVNTHEKTICDLDKDNTRLWKKLNSNTRIAVYAVIGAVGAIGIWVIKGLM